MKRRVKIPLLAVIVLAVALSSGFAVAQVIEGESESERPPIDRFDPDPSTNAREIGDALTEATRSGDQAAEERAAKAVRDELLSRLQPDEAAAMEDASPEPSVPADTYAYLNPAIDEGQVDQCRGWLEDGRDDELCELIVLHGEGKIEAGPYTQAEVEAILNEEGSGCRHDRRLPCLGRAG